jgi:hypothetical protein
MQLTAELARIAIAVLFTEHDMDGIRARRPSSY